MPIKGLTERRRLPRIGKLHLGVMVVKGEKKYPKATDYFVYPTEGAPGYELCDELVGHFGEKPRELRVIFPLDDEEAMASQYYRAYSKTRGLTCKGDGQTCNRMVDIITGDMANRDSKAVEMREFECLGRDCPDYQAKKCKELMCLQFMLPDISGLGIWQVDTSSINSIKNINSCFELIRAVYGRVAMVPMVLAMEQIEVTNPDDGKNKKVWVLNLRSTDNMVEAALKARKKPLELVMGIEDITEGEVDMPVADDERPQLVTPDHEPGVVATAKQDQPAEVIDADENPEVAVAKAAMKPANKEERATVKKAIAQPAQLPRNPGEFFTWLQKLNKAYTPTWFYRNFSQYTTESLNQPTVIAEAMADITAIKKYHEKIEGIIGKR